MFLIESFFYMSKKSKQKPKYLRTKRAFKVKQKAFFIIFKGLSVVKNCLRTLSAPSSWGAPTYQVTCPFDHVILWCRMTKKALYLHFHKTCKYQTWDIGNLPSHMNFWSCSHVMLRDKMKVLHLQSHKTYKRQLQSINLRARGSHLKSHMFLRWCGHLTSHNKKRVT